MRARVRAIVGARMVTRGAPTLVVTLLVAAAWPQVGAWLVPTAILWVFVESSFIALRERRRLRLALLEAGAEGRGLADMLLAWNEAAESGKSQTRMGAWLGEFLGREFDALPKGAERSWTRRGIGAARYFVPVAVALLLFWWLRPEVAMPWFGMGGASLAQGEGGRRGEDPGGGGSSIGAPSSQQGAPPTESPPPESGEPEREPDGPEPPTEPPAPFLDVPAQAQVVVPEFTRDGPTRRALAQQATVGSEAGGGAAPARQTSTGSGDQERSDPQAARERFERAAEKALQSRRVPERERPIVKSFFDALRGADK